MPEVKTDGTPHPLPAKRGLPSFKALQHAILGGRLSATLRYDARADSYAELSPYNIGEDEDFKEDEHGRRTIFKREPNWAKSTVMADALKQWLQSRDSRPRFFFPGKPSGPAFLDKSQPCFSAKLAAAVLVWEAVSRDPNLTKGVAVKRALVKWLENNAQRLGLVDAKGTRNQSAIAEIAAIANWNTKGGAPKTPVS